MKTCPECRDRQIDAALICNKCGFDFEASSHPELCAACAGIVESSELEWKQVGGISVGTQVLPLVWRLRDRYSSNAIRRNAKYAQKLAAASRLLYAVKSDVTDPAMLERIERFLEMKG